MSEGAGIRHDILERNEVSYHSHRHDFVEFIYMLRGECTHCVDNSEYNLKHGDLLIINYGQIHSITGNSPAEYINIFLKPQYINQSLSNQNNAFALLNLSEFTDFQKTIDQSKCKISFSGEDRDMIESILYNIESEFRESKSGHSLSVLSLFNILLIRIFRKMSLPLGEGFDGISDALLFYIRQNCDKTLKMEDVAKMCYYNPSYFSRVFKRFCGMRFTEYLKMIRIEHAAKLITGTTLTINEIYPKVGYSDKTKFFKHFRQIMGITPLQYRKSNK